MTDQSALVIMSRPGAAFQTETRVVLVSTGMRGPQGRPGPEGPIGDDGAGINIIGPWASGTIYGPNDAVIAQSSTLQGVVNLYIQRSNQPSSVSTIEPGDDPARWIETGVIGFGGSTGNIWTVVQLNHGFTVVGTPVFWNEGLDLYQPASSATLGLLPVAVIREIPDGNNLILQSSGLIPYVDPLVVEGSAVPAVTITGSSVDTLGEYAEIGSESGIGYAVIDNTDGWVDGTVYYQRPSGLVDIVPPPTGFSVPVFKAIGAGAIVFPYQNADAIPTPAPAPAPATSYISIDDISGGFNGVADQFALTTLAAPIAFAPAESFSIFIDGHRQQPFVDYFIVNVSGNSNILFTEPPEGFQDFWALYAAT